MGVVLTEVSVTMVTITVVTISEDIGGGAFSEQAELKTDRSKLCRNVGVAFSAASDRFFFLAGPSRLGGVGSTVTVATVVDTISTSVSTSVVLISGVTTVVVVKPCDKFPSQHYSSRQEGW